MPCRYAMLLAPFCLIACAQAQDLPTGADWELHALGINTPERLARARGLAGGRTVTLAIVGQGGVSAELLAPVLIEGNMLEYRKWPAGQEADPKSNTHDTQAARVILDLALKLGLRLRILVFHAAEDWGDVAACFAQAGAEADIVALYQSFWGGFNPPAEGSPQAKMVSAIAEARNALFISPYGEVGDNATRDSLQGHAAKPSGEGLANFVTAIPLPFRTPGQLLTPLNRPGLDAEPITFIGPSYYASGAGGTCPAAEVTAVVAAFIIAASRDKPTPAAVLRVMRDSVTLSESDLAAIPGYNAESAASAVRQIRALDEMTVDGMRRLDAVGVLDLWRVCGWCEDQKLLQAEVTVGFCGWEPRQCG